MVRSMRSLLNCDAVEVGAPGDPCKIPLYTVITCTIEDCVALVGLAALC